MRGHHQTVERFATAERMTVLLAAVRCGFRERSAGDPAVVSASDGEDLFFDYGTICLCFRFPGVAAKVPCTHTRHGNSRRGEGN
jgi:hypothetical protein